MPYPSGTGCGPPGAHPWAFITLDLVTALPYAIGLARVIRLALQRDVRRLPPWGAFPAAILIASYGYVFAAGDDIATYVLVALVVLLALGFASVAGRVNRALPSA